jgi:hypothetical protein
MEETRSCGLEEMDVVILENKIENFRGQETKEK